MFSLREPPKLTKLTNLMIFGTHIAMVLPSPWYLYFKYPYFIGDIFLLLKAFHYERSNCFSYYHASLCSSWKKNGKLIRWGSVVDWYFQSLTPDIGSITRNSNIFYSVRVEYHLKLLLVPCTIVLSSIAARNVNFFLASIPIEFFFKSHSSTVPEMKTFYSFMVECQLNFFQDPCSLKWKYIFFLWGRVPIEFLSHLKNLEAHFRQGAPLLWSPYF